MQPSLWLRSICLKNGLRLGDEQLHRLEEFVRLLLHHNKSVNLISRKDEQNVWENHLLHSLSPLFMLSFKDLRTVLDLGTGGGLPGIPLSIAAPVLQFTVVDSVGKKSKIVQEIVSELGLRNVRVVCSRAEELAGQRSYRRAFDMVVCRAVGPLKKLVVWSRPLVRVPGPRSTGEQRQEEKIRIPGGTLLAFKGGDITSETRDLGRNTGGEILQEIPLVFHGSETVSLVDKKIVLIRFSK